MNRLAPKESLVLELLVAHGEAYGLELVETSAGALKRGTVYVTLGRMEEKGLVAVREDPAPATHPGMPRRRYRPTALGRRALAAEEVWRLAMSGGARVRAGAR